MHSYQLLAAKILVQDTETGGFLKLLHGWTQSPDEAHDFQTTANAWEFCREGQLSGVRLVLHTDHRQHDVVVAADRSALEFPPRSVIAA